MTLEILHPLLHLCVSVAVYLNLVVEICSNLLKSLPDKSQETKDLASPLSSAFWHRFGGATRDRTADLLRAKQALSQLSYSPKSDDARRKSVLRLPSSVLCMVGLGGFEPPTSPLSGVRSNQLSYRPNILPHALAFGFQSVFMQTRHRACWPLSS